MNNVKNIAALFALALLTTACGASNQSAIKAAPISVPAAAPAAASSEAPAEAADATPEAPAEKAAETPEEKSATETGDNAIMFTQMLISTLFSSMLLSKTLLSTVRTCPCMSYAVAVQLFRCRRIRSTALVQWVFSPSYRVTNSRFQFLGSESRRPELTLMTAFSKIRVSEFRQADFAFKANQDFSMSFHE